MEDGNPLPGIITIIILIIINAILSTAKTAIDGVNENDMKKTAERGDKKAQLVVKLLKKPNRYMYAVELMLTGTCMLVGFIYAQALYARVITWAEKLPVELEPSIGRILFMVLTFLILLYLVTLFGSLLPKKLALKNPSRSALNTVRIAAFVMFLFRPLTLILEISVRLALRVCGIKPGDLDENVTEEELISMVNEGHVQGILEASEAEMISNIIEFNEKEVKDIMTHRKKIMAVNADLPVEEAFHIMLNENYSRFPLYEENLDNIIGILHLKDITRYYVANKGKDMTLKELARKPLFVPDTKNINAVFSDMQVSKIHMAIAIDEYGQTAGLVAMEDVLEKIVGNILDEYDVDENFIIEQGNGRYLVKGLANLEDVSETLGIDIEEEDYDTLNGLLISLLGRIPSDGERPTINYHGYSFHVVDVKNKLIRYVKVAKLPLDYV